MYVTVFDKSWLLYTLTCMCMSSIYKFKSVYVYLLCSAKTLMIFVNISKSP